MRRLAALLLGLMVLIAGTGAPARAAVATTQLSGAGLKVVFAARPRANLGARDSAQMIFTVDFSRGFDLVTQITHPDGYNYDWPTWAFGGTKIVYTAVDVAAPEKGQNLYMMNADGSDRVQLTFGTWRSVQPKVSPDGTRILFTAQWHQYPLVALYEYDLVTGEVRNVSAATSEDGARDSDPRWSADGSRIVFSNTRGPNGTPEMPTQIFSMAADGTDRIQLTHDSWWNTDPSLSPDGTVVAISSYRGAGTPNPPGADESVVKFNDWHLVLLDTKTGHERVVTGGLDCTTRQPSAPCSPTDGAAWVPKWSPDGSMIGYLSVRSWDDHGIYVVDKNGQNARPLVEMPDLTMTWWDWTALSSPDTFRPFSAPPRIDDRALLIGERPEKDSSLTLATSSADRWMDATLPAMSVDGVDLSPDMARWTPDKKHIVFTARHPYDKSGHPVDTTPLGQQRNVHYTFNDYTFVEMPKSETDIAEEQVFMADADGTHVRALTNPWTEDWLEAMPDGDARGNTDPDVSPDGRYVVFTNTSTAIPESYILRLDLKTGEVINLSAISSGAMAVADAKPRFSPDGRSIAFSSIIGTQRQLFVMDLDGGNVRQVTNDDYNDLDAAWSPDGRQLVYSSYRGTTLFADDQATPTKALDLTNWYLAKVDLATGRMQTLTTAEESPAFRPVWSPDGKRIAYISAGLTKKQIDVAIMNADGTDRHSIVTLRAHEEFVDWR